MKDTTDRLIQQLFTLLRAGLWEDNTPDYLLFEGGDTDWLALYKLSQEQTVVAIVWDGIEKLPTKLQPPKDLQLKWYSYMVRVEQINKKLNIKVVEVMEMYRNKGAYPILLKGAGVATFYRNPMRRGCGDIDLYVGEGESFDIANKISLEVLHGIDIHESMNLHRHEYHTTYKLPNGIIIENHKKFITHFTPLIERRFNAQLEAWYPANHDTVEIEGHEIAIPPLSFNAQYVFIHMYRHLFSYGVGLRQICDWAVLVDRLNGEQIPLVGYKQGWQVMAGFLVEYMGVAPKKIPHFKRVYPSKNRLILDMILDGGNFGHNLTNPRPKGYWTGKIFSFKRQISRWPKQMIISATDTINYLLFCVLKEIIVYIVEFTKAKLTRKK